MRRVAVLACIAAAASSPAIAATPREMLATAAFDATDKAAALGLVNQAIAAADGVLAATPGDREGQLAKATGTGYHAKLTRSPAEAKQARVLIERVAAANPRDAEGQLSIAGWHLDSVAEGFLTATVLGAKKDIGLAALDRSVALGGNRAFFKGFGALMRTRLDPADPQARALAEQAATAPTPTPLDLRAKRSAALLLVPLRAGDTKAAATLARRLLPFGRL